jgi:hypothetical protein
LTTPRQFGAVLAAALVLALAAVACSEEEVIGFTESGLASEGADEFEAVGVSLRGALDCNLTEKPGVTDENGDLAYSLECVGTTDDGKEVTLSGDTDGGSFVGKVDGEQVFEKDCIGSDC